jgi:hypothetical protein
LSVVLCLFLVREDDDGDAAAAELEAEAEDIDVLKLGYHLILVV